VQAVPKEAKSDDETVITKNNPDAPDKRPSDQALAQKVNILELDLKQTKAIVTTEKAAKRKLYSSLVKLASELKRMRAEHLPLADATRRANQSWYEGGMWRAPKVLPGVSANGKHVVQKAIGLSELFFDLVVVTAFTRVGVAVAESKIVDLHDLLYFGVFWMIWTKETNYTTRFDVSDLSAQFVTLLTCFATLFASLGTVASVNSVDGTRIMMAAGFVAALHCLLHVRVAFWYSGAGPGTVDYHAKRYAIFTIVMTLLETSTWAIGIYFLPQDYEYRWAIMLGAMALSIRVPRAFLANDFHGKNRQLHC
jgi:Bacterial low temperature requirement A protein (LtrA)